MYYSRKRHVKRKYVYGGGLLDSLLSAVTSQAAKEVGTHVAKEVTKKALTEVGNRGVQKIIGPPKRGNGLNNNSIEILKKYNAIPIQDYVKK